MIEIKGSVGLARGAFFVFGAIWRTDGTHVFCRCRFLPMCCPCGTYLKYGLIQVIVDLCVIFDRMFLKNPHFIGRQHYSPSVP